MGEIHGFARTKGNVDDRKEEIIKNISKNIFEKLFANKGYISSGFFEMLFSKWGHLFTNIRRNMKKAL